MELLQFPTGFEPEFLDEPPPCVCVDAQRLLLAIASVEREHPQDGQPLSFGVRRHQRLQFGDERPVLSERKPGVDPFLERRQPKLLQPRDLGLDERLIGEIRERRSAPERDRLPEQRCGLRGPVLVVRPPAAFKQAGEPFAVEALTVDVQDIAPRPRRQQVRRLQGLAARRARCFEPPTGIARPSFRTSSGPSSKNSTIRPPFGRR